MKFTRVAFAFLSVCVLLAGTAFAQTIYYVSDESQKDGDDSAQKDGKDECQKDGKDACQKGVDCCPFELFPETCRGVKVGGWFQMGYHTQGANANNAALAVVDPNWAGGVHLPGVGGTTNAFNNYPNVLQLQQAWVYAEKVAETCGCGWDWGFRVDYVYGTDGQDVQSFGNVPGIWDEPWDNGGFYGSAIPQAYGEVAYNDLSVKVGHFFQIAGYEKAAAPENFFYSHSISFYREPRTHTGALAEYAVSDRLSVQGGWTAGWDTGFDQNGGDMFLGGITFDVTDNMSLAYVVAAGDFGFATAQGSDSDGYAHTLVLDWDVTCRLNYVLQTNYADNDLFTALAGPALTVNQYLLYDINCKWAVGGRFEYVHTAGANVDFSEYTIGANYRPRSNILIRPEMRLDVLNDMPAGLGVRDSTVFGVDAIFMF